MKSLKYKRFGVFFRPLKRIVIIFLLCVSFSGNAQCNLLCNTDFENNQITSSVAIVDASQVPCWQTTASDNKIEVWHTGFNGVPSYSGSQFIELNAFMVSTLYQNFVTAPGTNVSVSFAHRGRAGIDVMSVEIGPVGGPYVSLGNFSDGTSAWGYYTVNYVIPAGFGNNYMLRFNSVSAAGGNPALGNFLDAISVNLPSAATLNFTTTPAGCGGTNNGTASVTVSNGLAPYSYTWSPSGVHSASVSGLSAGIYTVNVGESNGCSVSGTVQVLQGAALSTTVAAQNETCQGASNGSVQVAVSGGQAPYSYTWSPTAIHTSTLGNLSAGNYTVTVADVSGCQATATVAVNAGSAIVSTITAQHISCLGANDGVAQVVASGGLAPYSYTWAPAGAGTATITNLSSGYYTVSIQSGNGCTGTNTIYINEGLPLSGTITPQHISCFGANDGQVHIALAGGVAPYSYTWSPGALTTTSLTNLPAGNYSVVVTSANGCAGNFSVAVNDGSPLPVTLVFNDISCFGMNDGSISAVASAGTGPYSYTWSPAVSSSSVIANLAAGNYSVQVASSNGCFGSATQLIAEPLPLVVNGTSHNVSCYGYTDGSIKVTASGGTTPYNYTWAPSNANVDSVYSLPSGIYSCTVSDFHQCTTLASFTITEAPQLVLGINSATVCPMQSAVLTASGAQSYTWNPGNITGSSAEFSPPTTTGYTVSATYLNGCITSTTTSIYVYPLPLSNAGNDTTVNMDEPLVLTGIGSDFYGWEFSTGEALNCNFCHQIIVNPQENTCYVLKAINSYNCINRDTICVTVTADWSLYIPNAFSPVRVDDVNDVFIPVGYGIDELQLIIFDRWGEKIFETSEKNKGWDGKYKGLLCKPDVYVYLVNFKTMNKYEGKRTGSVTLVR